MALRSTQLLTINATVIMGLLILLSFEFIGVTINDDLLTKINNDREEYVIRNTVLSTMIQTKCGIEEPNPFNKFENFDPLQPKECRGYSDEFQQNYATLLVLTNKTNSINEAEDKKWITPFSELGGILAPFIVIPFTLSALLEVVKTHLNPKLDNNASNISMILMEIGFGLLFVVLFISAILNARLEIVT